MAHIDSVTEDKLGHADLVEEVDLEGRKITKITGVANPGKTVSLLLRGSNKLVGLWNEIHGRCWTNQSVHFMMPCVWYVVL